MKTATYYPTICDFAAIDLCYIIGMDPKLPKEEKKEEGLEWKGGENWRRGIIERPPEKKEKEEDKKEIEQ